MAASGALPFQSTTPHTSNMDTFDLDRFLNLDNVLSPSAGSSDPSHKIAPNPTLIPTQEQLNQEYLSRQTATPQNWSRPSFQYDLHKQQAGLPVGALANTISSNSNNQYLYNTSPMYGHPSTGNSSLGLDTGKFDFNVSPMQVSLSAHSNMDFDFGSPPNDTLMFEGESTDVFIDPAAIGGQEEPSNQRRRVYPGIHSEQAQKAAEAKAQAEAERKAHQAQPRQTSTKVNGKALDPIMEESISRVLNQMRHNSAISATDSQDSPSAGTGSSNSRSKKEEEDMDEDERLLASEEGKKLSSKERRQLRNKVSARAFRSRRKEYIGQLEGEIAQKTQEADDLKAKNEDLMAENKRLTDLTKMLLSSPSFSSFLGEISQPASTTTSTTSPTEQSIKPEKTEYGASQATFQTPKVPQQPTNAQVGMTFVPEPQLSYGSYASQNNDWIDENDMSLYNAQVFAVTSVPEGPRFSELNIENLSGKSTKAPTSSFTTFPPKPQSPQITFMPTTASEDKETRPATFDDDQTFDLEDLYSPTSSIPASLPPATLSVPLFDSKKEPTSIRLTTRDHSMSEGSSKQSMDDQFDSLCKALEELSVSIMNLTSSI